MPRFFRAMLHENEAPLVGSDKNMLGVRVPPEPTADIRPDDEGMVHPGTGGMSVAPAWRELPNFLIPKRLRELAPKARGSNELVCFRYGDGDFELTNVNDKLRLSPDSATHATIQPAVTMLLSDFQSAIGATRDSWIKDED